MGTDSSTETLTLFDSVGMAVGGMVGGGIFAVLGVAVVRAGSGAFVSFGLAGLLALVTGLSYAKLTCSFDEPGGSFSFVEELAGADLAGILSWLLILGYVFTISLYAYTFGEYSAEFLPWDSPILPTLLGGGAIAGLTLLNLIGVRESGVTEDVLVYGKILILFSLVAIGLVFGDFNRVVPVFARGPATIVSTAAMIFVGFEGFQLLTYDYGAIENHRRTLPRAMIGSILLVTVLYMLIAFVTSGTLPASVVKSHTETVLARVAQPILGQFGFSLIVAAAVVSTASAINATIFATARLGKRVADDGELPGVLVNRLSGGVPVVFTVGMAVVAFVIQYLGSLHRITEFSSLVFLFVFGVVNLAAWFHGEYSGWCTVLPLGGFAGCWGAGGILVYSFYRTRPAVLWMTAGIVLVLLILWTLFNYASLVGSE